MVTQRRNAWIRRGLERRKVVDWRFIYIYIYMDMDVSKNKGTPLFCVMW